MSTRFGLLMSCVAQNRAVERLRRCPDPSILARFGSVSVCGCSAPVHGCRSSDAHSPAPETGALHRVAARYACVSGLVGRKLNSPGICPILRALVSAQGAWNWRNKEDKDYGFENWIGRHEWDRQHQIGCLFEGPTRQAGRRV